MHYVWTVVYDVANDGGEQKGARLTALGGSSVEHYSRRGETSQPNNIFQNGLLLLYMQLLTSYVS